MTCSECKFYLSYDHDFTCPILGKRTFEGICRRYPVVEHKNLAHWCGEWKTNNPKAKRNAKKLLESQEFQEFYEAYPKKTARGHANKAFIAAEECNWAMIIERARLFAQAVISDGRDMTYVKHPATWINSECWKDKEEVKGDSKACIDCGAAYAEGHKYAFKDGKIIKGKYKCKACRSK